MGKKSVRENKNIYQLSREAAEMTRAEAAEATFISEDRIEKIEYGTTTPHPDEVLKMAEHYKNLTLCNYYCTHECEIGQKYIPEVKIKDISQITLEMLANLNLLTKEKDRLIEITVDGTISEDEMPDFLTIQEHLEKMTLAVDSLKLWVDSSILKGKVN